MNYAFNMMRAVFVGAMLALFAATLPSAHAAEQTWRFNGTLNDSAFSGSFSFDDATAFTLEGFDRSTCTPFAAS